jgi:peroxiredoxin
MNEDKVHSRLQIGTFAPNLTLVNVQNQPINLADLWANGPTLLTFLRHFG